MIFVNMFIDIIVEIFSLSSLEEVKVAALYWLPTLRTIVTCVDPKITWADVDLSNLLLVIRRDQSNRLRVVLDKLIAILRTNRDESAVSDDLSRSLQLVDAIILLGNIPIVPTIVSVYQTLDEELLSTTELGAALASAVVVELERRLSYFDHVVISDRFVELCTHYATTGDTTPLTECGHHSNLTIKLSDGAFNNPLFYELFRKWFN